MGIERILDLLVGRDPRQEEAEEEAHLVKTGREDKALVWIDYHTGKVFDSLPVPKRGTLQWVEE